MGLRHSSRPRFSSRRSWLMASAKVVSAGGSSIAASVSVALAPVSISVLAAVFASALAPASVIASETAAVSGAVSVSLEHAAKISAIAPVKTADRMKSS